MTMKRSRPAPFPTHPRTVLLALALAAGCVGKVEEAPPQGSPADRAAATDRSGGAGGVRSESRGKRADSAGALPLARLTRSQLSNTIRDLLGDDSRPGDDLPADVAGDSGFSQPGTMGPLEVRRTMEIAERVAKRAVERLSTLVPCDPKTTGEKESEACGRAFIERFGRRAYRRPLLQEEREALVAAFTAERARSGFADAAQLVIQAMLQSPSFLYRWELGPRPAKRSGELVRLDDHEVASRLSYYIWGSMPDEQLFAAADAGRLKEPAEIAAQARRLLADPRADATLVGFHEEWLGIEGLAAIDKDRKTYPDFVPELRQAMIDETRTFVRHVLREGDGKLATLVGAHFSFVDARLAKLYGVPAPADAGLVKVALDPTQRFGVLTQASLLSAHAHPGESAPVQRGRFVREQLLCQEVPPPPAEANTQPPPPDPKKTAREQLARHVEDPACGGCHQLMDPLGFALESYDGIGRHRTTTRQGRPVDASGTLVGVGPRDRSFQTTPEFLQLIVDSEEIRRCAATKWLRYALGRKEGAGDAATLEEVHAMFATSGHDIRQLIVALVSTDSFRLRRPSAGEVLQ